MRWRWFALIIAAMVIAAIAIRLRAALADLMDSYYSVVIMLVATIVVNVMETSTWSKRAAEERIEEERR